MSKRLKSATAVFVFGQLDRIFLYVPAMHMIYKDSVMICFSILYKASLGMNQYCLSMSRFTPCMSMKRGLSVMGDCQCSYSDRVGRVSDACNYNTRHPSRTYLP